MTRLLLIGIGLILSLFGLNDLFTTRARFVNSNPAPGTSVYSPPTVVTVTFSEELAPQSEISVVSTVTLLPSGETSYSSGGKASTTSSIDVYDPQHRSLKAVLLLE